VAFVSPPCPAWRPLVSHTLLLYLLPTKWTGAIDALHTLKIETAEPTSEDEVPADDESEDESEDDIDRPLNAFERAHPMLLKLLKRSSSTLTGPESIADLPDKGKPSEFFRVCDGKPFLTFNDDEDFFNRSFVELPGWFFIDATGFVDHIN
jgi:hypothetical protein